MDDEYMCIPRVEYYSTVNGVFHKVLFRKVKFVSKWIELGKSILR